MPHVPPAVDYVLAALACVHDHMPPGVFHAGERGLVVHLRPALLDRPVVGIAPVQVRRGAAEEIHAHRDAAREMEGHAPAPGGVVQRLARNRPEVLQQKTVTARREDAAADLVPRQFLPLEDDGMQARVHQPLGGGGGGKARTHDDDVC